jgi:hypothetical protein
MAGPEPTNRLLLTLDRQVRGNWPFLADPTSGGEVWVSASTAPQQAERSLRLAAPVRGLAWDLPYPQMTRKACRVAVRIPSRRLLRFDQ